MWQLPEDTVAGAACEVVEVVEVVVNAKDAAGSYPPGASPTDVDDPKLPSNALGMSGACPPPILSI